MKPTRSSTRRSKMPSRYREQPDTPDNNNTFSSTTTATPSVAVNNNATATADAPSSEAPTIVPTPDDVNNNNDDAVDDASQLTIAADSSRQQTAAAPLLYRVPSCEEVIKDVSSLSTIQTYFKHSIVYTDTADQERFFESEEAVTLWSTIADKLTDAIKRYTPKEEKDIKRMAAKFELEKQDIIDSYIGNYELFAKGSEEAGTNNIKWDTMVDLLYVIGIEFIRLFQALITPPNGQKRVAINEQIEALVTKAVDQPVTDLFDNKNLHKHAYYIIGFLCHAGAKEAGRRTNDNDIGLCIKSLDNHFAVGRDELKLAGIRTELPEGVTALVDQRCKMGGLKYPDLQLYTCFAIIEKVYSELATPINFALFGGMLLPKICQGILKNQTLVALFTGLYEDADVDFSADTIAVAFGYYMNVFGNVRAKELCYRYNSTIQKGATVGLRQSLAGGATGGKKKTKSRKKRKKAEEKEAEEEKAEEEEQTTQQQAMDIDGEEDADDESIHKDRELSEAGQHDALLQLAEEDIDDDEDYEKECKPINDNDDPNMYTDAAEEINIT